MFQHLQYQSDLRTSLGKGAQGSVYLGTDQSTGAQVAVKKVRLGNDMARANFRREIENLQQVSSPYVVQYLAHQDFDDQAFIVMEYIEGKPLEDLIPVNEDTALRWLRQMVLGLNAAWDKSIIHRDLKPGNIMITPGHIWGGVKICDFGISKCIEEIPGQTFIGTRKYMAPEVGESEGYGVEADIWSLGVVLYEMLVGTIRGDKVHSELLLRQLREKPISNTAFDLVRRMLIEDPKQRISKEDLTSELRKAGPAFQYLHYESNLTKDLGSGNQGGVSLGKDLRDGKPVAVKQLPLESKKAKKYFKQEIQNLQKVSSPYIVQYLDHQEFKDEAFIIMEYVAGQTLQKILSKNKSGIDEQSAISWLQQMVEGLTTTWEHSIIHRDLKPANIIITDQQRQVKICDFGISKNIAKDVGETEIGTGRYIAPEVLRHEKYGITADVWSLGVVFYEMLAGYVNGKVIHVQELLENLRTRRVSDWSIQLIGRMLESDSNRRISHIDLIQELLTPIEKRLSKGDRCEIVLYNHTRTSTLFIKKTLFLKDWIRYPIDIRNSPSIVHWYQSCVIDKSVAFVTEYCAGGDLRSFIENRGATYETAAKGLMWKLLEALKSLNTDEAVYRGIKAEHILLSLPDYTADVKFSNFYITQKISELLKEQRGEHIYLAPELLNRQQGSQKSAVWSLGCVFYFLITGQHPIQSGLALRDAQLRIPQFEGVSLQCTDLIERMLNPMIGSRIMLQDCFSHEFFRTSLELTLQPPAIDNGVIQLYPLHKAYDILEKTIELAKKLRDKNNVIASYLLLNLMRLYVHKVDSLLIQPVSTVQIDFQYHDSALSAFSTDLLEHINVQQAWAEYQFKKEKVERPHTYSLAIDDMETLPNCVFALCLRMLRQENPAASRDGAEIMRLLYSAKVLLGTQRAESLRFHQLYNSLWTKANSPITY